MAENIVIEELKNIKQEIFNTIYPVGSIYISTNSANPSSFLGGGGRQQKASSFLRKAPHIKPVPLGAKPLIR